ncbi:hypothetical protein Glove_151g141 [Diversispora epigaea]|uniref:Uncharacterized protein n=1 Tax=Diversispora epigaea TaxID=1348612 RepID=A0A397J1F0_9GLOM|nr:hypothetical protein Glove_151g141 [Diversispora epigaea]
MLEYWQPSRIVSLSSIAHCGASECGIDFENINNPNAYGPCLRYELNKRLAEKEVYVSSVYPSIVKTEIFPEEGTGAIALLYFVTSPEIIEKKLRRKYIASVGKLGPEKSKTDENLALKLLEYSLSLEEIHAVQANPVYSKKCKHLKSPKFVVDLYQSRDFARGIHNINLLPYIPTNLSRKAYNGSRISTLKCSVNPTKEEYSLISGVSHILPKSHDTEKTFQQSNIIIKDDKGDLELMQEIKELRFRWTNKAT